MSNVYFISDLHFGHKGMAQKYRKFQDEFSHDEHIIEQWNKTVKSKKDLTFILGDITMKKSFYYYQLDRLNGKKKVILGNHDRIQDVHELLKYVESVAGMMEYKGHILTHCPIHPQELRRWGKNIHGHLHENFVMNGDIRDDRYINACCDVLDYRPRTLEELLNFDYKRV